MIRVLLTSIGMQLIGLIVPLLTKTVIDSVLPLQISDVMPVLGVGILLSFPAGVRLPARARDREPPSQA